MRCGVRTLRCARELFEEFGLDPLLGEELWHQLQVEPAAAEVIGVQERERQIMADWYECTWVDVRGDKDVERYRGIRRTFSSDAERSGLEG